MFDFRRIALFYLVKRLSKHKMTLFSENLGGMSPMASPGYAYGQYHSNRRPISFISSLEKTN